MVLMSLSNAFYLHCLSLPIRVQNVVMICTALAASVNGTWLDLFHRNRECVYNISSLFSRSDGSEENRHAK